MESDAEKNTNEKVPKHTRQTELIPARFGPR